MLRITILSLVVIFITTSVWAGFGLPKVSTGNSTVNKVANTAVDTAKNKGLEKVINDKLAKQNCQFKDAMTKTDTTCDLNKVVSELESWRSGLEGTIANDVDVHVEASAKSSGLAYDRGSYVRGKLYQTINYWDYDVTSNTSSDKGLKIWVSVH